MDFIEMWQQAIDNDPYWQFEELLEDDPELAEEIWNNMRIKILAERRLGFEVPWKLFYRFIAYPQKRKENDENR